MNREQSLFKQIPLLLSHFSEILAFLMPEHIDFELEIVEIAVLQPRLVDERQLKNIFEAFRLLIEAIVLIYHNVCFFLPQCSYNSEFMGTSVMVVFL